MFKLLLAELSLLIQRTLCGSQERAGVKMILIQDASQPPNMDKPLRIIGDPYKVEVLHSLLTPTTLTLLSGGTLPLTNPNPLHHVPNTPQRIHIRM